MVYKFKSASRIVFELYDEGIKSTDSNGRIATWCLKALKALNVSKTRFQSSATIKIVDYTVTIPNEIDTIDSIECNGVKLYEIRKTRPIERENIVYTNSYAIDNGKINFSMTDVDVTINGKVYPIEFDAEFNGFFPLYPDIEEVEEYLKLYCIRRMILRGYNHPHYSFNVVNNQTNINILVDKAKRTAKLRINQMSGEQRRRIANMLTRADVNPQLDVTRLFK